MMDVIVFIGCIVVAIILLAGLAPDRTKFPYNHFKDGKLPGE